MTEACANTFDATLSDRQLRFVHEYLVDQNASAAAVRAGYSEKSRACAANELMNHPAVQARLRDALQNLLSALRCKALDLMRERMRAAFFRAEKMFASGWELRALGEMEAETRAALEVRTVLRKSGPVTHIRQPDRDKALRALEKVHERLEHVREKYWARLAKEGKVKSLAEIEAMDGGGAEDAPGPDAVPGGVAEKNGGFPGAQGWAAMARAAPIADTAKQTPGSRFIRDAVAAIFSGKPIHFLGSGRAAGLPAANFPEQPVGFPGVAPRARAPA